MNVSPKTDEILERLLTLHPKLIDLTLDRVLALLEKLGNPHHHLPPVIHISGTNGKGSVLAMLRGLLLAHGLRVHAYSSPHLVHFHERIYLCDGFISDEMLQDYLTRCEQANDGEPITFFEITTCAALLAFSEIPADIVILETGLGGRLDATNVIDHPLLTIITHISLDHQQYLGETIEEIAFEKAGILKKNVPVISVTQQKNVRQILQKQAFEKGTAALWLEGKEYRYHQEFDAQEWDYILGSRVKHHLPAPYLKGAHQYQNAACALSALYQLASHGFLTIDDAFVKKGFADTRWPARLQPIDSFWQEIFQLTHQPQSVWLDGSHNVMGAAMLRDFIMAENRKTNMPTYFIIAMLNSKDVTNFIKNLGQVIDYGVAVKIPDQDSSMSAIDFSLLAQNNNVSLSPKATIREAMYEINQLANGRDYRLVITGSLYFAGYILRHGTSL